MKTLPLKTVTVLCLLMLTGFTNKAQDNKPSKQETIEYIENYFKDEFYSSGRFKSGFALKSMGGWRDFIYEIKRVSIVNNQLTFSYSITTQNIIPGVNTTADIEHFTNSINLNKVESISIRKTGEQYFVYSLIFNEKNNPNSKEPDLPFARTDEEDFGVIRELQIYKAFQHLRKLCGAPEPMKF